MTWAELEREPITGELNINVFVSDESGLVFLKRIPKDNPKIMDSITLEYQNIGFFEHGGSFRRRNPSEQIAFAEHAKSKGLRVLTPTASAGEITYYQFVAGTKTLDEFLQESPGDEAINITQQLFEDLRSAHQQGIIYGDRWSKNILVHPDVGVIHIDYDLQLDGDPKKEFEVAQVAYYVLCGGRNKIIDSLALILANGSNWFHFGLIAKFLVGHACHFQNSSKYGNAEQDVAKLLELVNIYQKPEEQPLSSPPILVFGT